MPDRGAIIIDAMASIKTEYP